MAKRQTEAPAARRPTKAEVAAAVGRTVADVIGPDLAVLFCGINPGLYTAAIGHHFGRPGNRFWPALHLAGFTPRQLDPREERELLVWGYGITNIVSGATATAAELSREQLAAGALTLVRKVRKYRPRFLAVVGLDAYRKAFARPKAPPGLQTEAIGATRIWLLPHPSGLNANYQLADFARAFRELRLAAEQDAEDGSRDSLAQ
jgi:TDG/mug DNA glycosylase family protein